MERERREFGRRLPRGCSRLRELDKHLCEHVEVKAGQRGAAADTSGKCKSLSVSDTHVVTNIGPYIYAVKGDRAVRNRQVLE